MRDLTYLDKKRISIPGFELVGKHCGIFNINYEGTYFRVIASIDGEGENTWEHVSVSHPQRTPSWDVMCKMKDLFFDDEEKVIQFHPKKSQYVNFHEHCLHMWRPVNKELFVPKDVK